MLPMSDDSGEPCLFCDEPTIVELLEIWIAEFHLSTCCLGMYEWLVHEMAEAPEFRLHLLRQFGAEAYLGSSLRRIADNDGQLLLDSHLRIAPVSFKAAAGFVARYGVAGCPVRSAALTTAF